MSPNDWLRAMTARDWETILRALPDRQGEALYLRYAKRLRQREAAERMGIALASYQGLLKRAIANLAARRSTAREG